MAGEFTGAPVTVRFLRDYPYKGRTYVPGQVLEVPDWSAATMLRGGWAERVTEEGTEDPDEPVDATDGARELAAEHGFDLTPYHGRGSGPDGRIYVDDVERWITSA